ncbi:MAG: hypothetical protein U0704_11770 [Candidatus Eisenbacteria bacterium]
MSARVRTLLFAALVLLALLAASCGKKLYTGFLPANQRPTLELTQAPAAPSQTYFYAYEMRWAGFDMDGSVAYYEYAVDPPGRTGSDTAWVKTTKNRETFQFRSDVVDTVGAPTAHGYHTFVVRAVDDAGDRSEPRSCSFNSFTLAPTVTLISPVPNHLNQPLFGPAFRVMWKGTDPDGRTTTKPVKYKWKVFAEDNLEFDFLELLVDPDSLRKFYAPNFATWDSVSGDTTWADLKQLQPNKRYALVLIAFDEAGAYSPVFSFDSSMLYFGVSVVGTLGPTMSIWNDTFYYKYSGGQFSVDESSFLKVEVAADTPLRFGWNGATSYGAFVQGYRWRLDGDIGDETPRTNEYTDIHHWSQWSPSATSCELPAIVPSGGRYTETHYLYVQAKDNEEMVSMAALKLTAIRPTFAKPLLIVDDTRLTPDKLLTTNPPVTDKPRGTWPMAAELDTFFFARGGRPWKDYPAGSLSPVGVFAGYSYDTVATRFIRGGTLSLTQLGEYQHVIWYVDYTSATYTNPVDFSINPMPALHAMSYPGATNQLSVWVRQGGRLWMFGGGTAASLQKEWEKSGTNGLIFSAADGELAGGRLMFDGPHWQSEITLGASSQAKRQEGSPRAWPGAPSFARLPEQLFEKSLATDPMSVYAPSRTNAADFYRTSYQAEALTKANVISEDADPDPNLLRMEPTLDTLYVTVGGSLGIGRPIMTYYHGRENTPVVYSGFPIWYFRREHVIPLVDWVLQDAWGLPRANVPR